MNLNNEIVADPTMEELQRTVDLLVTLSNPTDVNHRVVLQSLTSILANSSIIISMMFVFTNGTNIPSNLRQLSGLIIKNSVFPQYLQLLPSIQQAILRNIFNALQDPIIAIRQTAANLIGKITASFPITIWIDMINQLLQVVEIQLFPQHPILLDGALLAIKQVCEDSAFKLSSDDINRPLDILIPKLIGFFDCSEPQLKIRALQSYNSLLYLLDPNGPHSRNESFEESSSPSGGRLVASFTMGSMESASGSPNSLSGTQRSRIQAISPSIGNASYPLVIHMATFIQSIAALAGDTNEEVRRCVCEALTIIAKVHVAMLEPYFASVCAFMLNSLLDSSEPVAIEACEYWSALLVTPDTKSAMLPYLQPLIERLISRLVLTEEQMEQDRIDEEEENNGEKELPSLHYRSHSSAHNTQVSGSSANPLDYSMGETTTQGSSADGDNDHGRSKQRNDEGGNGNSYELSSKWTLRRQAGLTLDHVALSFPATDVLSFALPKIQEAFGNPSVMIRESGMLALGALSTGCLEEMISYIPQLLPFWFQNLQDPLPEMRSISCWVMSRYCGLFGEMYRLEVMQSPQLYPGGGGGGGGQQYYLDTLQAFLHAMFDEKIKVQVASCSALCLLIENSFYIKNPHPVDQAAAEDDEINILIDSLSFILTAISKAFEHYGVKSSLIVIDTIGTLADTVGDTMKNPMYTSLYMPQVVRKFMELDEFDPRLFPIMDCLTSVIAVIGLESQPYVMTIYGKCLQIIHHGLKEVASSTGERSGVDDLLLLRDFTFYGLDVISSICEALQSFFEVLVLGGTTDPQAPSTTPNTHQMLLELLFMALSNPYAEIRQSGFSLSGEICKNSFSLLRDQDIVNNLLTLACQNLNSEYPLICNNVAWTIGELASRVGSDFMRPHMNKLLLLLVEATHTPNLPDTVKINIGVTVGRLGVINTTEVAQVADEIFADWCSFLTFPCPLNEKSEAFSGLIAVTKMNPNVVLNNKTAIYSLISACASWNERSNDQLIHEMSQLLLAIQNHDPLLWGKVAQKFSSNNPMGWNNLQQLCDL